jgi:hypothetical protein
MDNPQKLKEFRGEVLSKMSEFWEDTKDIKITITGKLSQLMKRENLIGWVRPNSQSDLPALADEIARLSKENAQLRAQISVGNSNDKINGLSFSDLKQMLEKLGVLEMFRVERRRLSVGIYTPHIGSVRGELLELITCGLVEFRTSNLLLTESGRNFLNKLESEELLHPPAPES